MELNAIPTEQTTAATDLLLALAALAGTWYLRRGTGWRATIWAGVFVLMAFSALLGAAAHGLALADPDTSWLWGPAYLALGAMLALFAAGTVLDRWGEKAARRTLPAVLAWVLLFCAATFVLAGDFLAFVLFEGGVMLFALCCYTLAAVRHRPGSALTAAGILVTILAAFLQTRHGLRLTFVREFDNNGIFHLVQLPGLLLLLAGLRRGRSTGG
jgi:Family of unknown function (DUF6962)